MENCQCDCKKSCRRGNPCGGGGAVYGLGLIGSAVYFIQHSATFWEGVVGIGKAILWPAFLIHRVLELLGL